MKVIAEIQLDANPETIKHAQHVLDNWARFNPLHINVLEVVDKSEE